MAMVTSPSGIVDALRHRIPAAHIGLWRGFDAKSGENLRV